MEYSQYKQARDAAWEILIRCNVQELPVRVSGGCSKLGFALYSYEHGAKLIELFGLKQQCLICDGFTKLSHGKYYVFYNEQNPPPRIRFTIAHEIGHIVLGHLHAEGITTANREPNISDSPIEFQANIFASRLLAPACVLHALNAVTPEQIAELCDISLTSASFRAERMNLLNRRNKYGLSPLERKAQNQFERFIMSKI